MDIRGCLGKYHPGWIAGHRDRRQDCIRQLLHVHQDRSATRALIDQLKKLCNGSPDQPYADITENKIDGLKLSESLPPDQATEVLAAHLRDVDAIRVVLEDMLWVAITKC